MKTIDKVFAEIDADTAREKELQLESDWLFLKAMREAWGYAPAPPPPSAPTVMGGAEPSAVLH